MEVKKIRGNVVTIGKVGIDIPEFASRPIKEQRQHHRTNKKKAKFGLLGLFIVNLIALIPLIGYISGSTTSKVNLMNSIIFAIGVMVMGFNIGSKHRHMYNFMLGVALFAISFMTMI